MTPSVRSGPDLKKKFSSMFSSSEYTFPFLKIPLTVYRYDLSDCFILSNSTVPPHRRASTPQSSENGTYFFRPLFMYKWYMLETLLHSFRRSQYFIILSSPRIHSRSPFSHELNEQCKSEPIIKNDRGSDSISSYGSLLIKTSLSF